MRASKIIIMNEWMLHAFECQSAHFRENYYWETISIFGTGTKSHFDIDD